MIVITKIIVTPAKIGTMIYVTGRLWLLSLFDSACGEERKVVSKDIAVDRGVDTGRDIAVDRGVDIVAVLSTKIKTIITNKMHH